MYFNSLQDGSGVLDSDDLKAVAEQEQARKAQRKKKFEEKERKRQKVSPVPIRLSNKSSYFQNSSKSV